MVSEASRTKAVMDPPLENEIYVRIGWLLAGNDLYRASTCLESHTPRRSAYLN